MSSRIKHPITGEWIAYDDYRREQMARLAEFDGAARSDLAAPCVLRDDLGMHGILNHVDGKTYDSRSAYHEAIREAGRREGKQYEVVGDDKSFERPPKKEYVPEGIAQDLKDAYDKVVGV